MSETLILHKNIPNWQKLWHAIYISSPFRPHGIIPSFAWVCPYVLAYLQSPESVFGVSLTCTYKTYIFKQTHEWEWFSFFWKVLVCHYFCLFWKYHMALFPSESASEFPFPILGTLTTFTSFFSKVLYKQGKEIITCEYWTHGTPGACFGSRIFFFFLIQEMKGERQIFLWGLPRYRGYSHGTKSCFWKSSLGSSNRKCRKE